jgi:hypothetical protein
MMFPHCLPEAGVGEAVSVVRHALLVTAQAAALDCKPIQVGMGLTVDPTGEAVLLEREAEVICAPAKSPALTPWGSMSVTGMTLLAPRTALTLQSRLEVIPRLAQHPAQGRVLAIEQAELVVGADPQVVQAIPVFEVSAARRGHLEYFRLHRSLLGPFLLPDKGAGDVPATVGEFGLGGTNFVIRTHYLSLP